MAVQQFVIIVNPHSGKRRGPAVLEQVRPVFAAAGAELQVHVTESPGHASELAAALDLEGRDGICVIGGDGTLHEAVGGLMRREQPARIPLGVIPGGTGNSVAEHLGYLTAPEAARRILAGRVQPFDVARVRMGGRLAYCVNIVGWGFAVDINRTAEWLRVLGPPRYAIAALGQILRPRRRRARVTLDGQALEGDFLLVAGCNTRFTGKGMNLAPGAEAGDGLIDVVLVRRASRLQILLMLGRVFSGTHLALPCVEVRRVCSFAIESRSPHPLNLDGELTGSTPVEVAVLPSALRIFA